MTVPIPTAIANSIRDRILRGELPSGTKIESTRQAASQWKVSRGSVVSAYEQLIGEGYLEATRGGTVVARNVPVQVRRTHAPDTKPETPLVDLRPGRPDSLGITTTAWRSAWRQAAAQPQAYSAPGSRKLREEIAKHLSFTRSLTVDPEGIIITSGARDGLAQLIRLLDGPVAVADPGYPTLHNVPQRMGKKIVRFDINRMESIDPVAKVILVMPNHQYPTGEQMPAAQRLALLERAREIGAVIIEDDYDSELRRAHPALAALDSNVAFLGSFAKTLSPAIGLGYVVVPESLRQQVIDNALPVSGIVQDAMAVYLQSDGVRRHSAKMQREYRARRKIFAQVFPHGVAMDGGLHAVVEVDNENEVVEKARSQGLAVEGLSQYWTSSERHGIVLGLGTHSDARLKELLYKLARVIDEA